jgi:hypothetical protein
MTDGHDQRVSKHPPERVDTLMRELDQALADMSAQTSIARALVQRLREERDARPDENE